jgi:molybdopterin converting factor small subunit
VLRYWAAAKEAAGTSEERFSAQTLKEVLEKASAKHSNDDGRFAGVLARSSILVDGKQAGHRAADRFMLWDSAVIEVLPPFAGG